MGSDFDFQMDIWLIETEENIQISPKSIFGILWLQTHFEQTHWEAIASKQARIPQKDAQILFNHASQAGLQVNFLKKLCIINKF